MLAGGETTDLLRAVAEQLKVPLTTIARQAELSQMNGAVALQDIAAMHSQAATALTLVDSYLLGLELLREQTSLELEPVSVSSTLVDIAHDLYYIARQYGVELEVQVAGKYEPVMAHPRGLRAALLSLGYGMVEAQAAQDRPRHHHLTLATHRTPHGIVAGMYGEYEDLEADGWRTALALKGRTQQPFTGLTASSGAGLFVADTILRSMSTRLRVGRHQKEAGLATTLQPSQQLAFV
jgi:hypothetical protein